MPAIHFFRLFGGCAIVSLCASASSPLEPVSLPKGNPFFTPSRIANVTIAPLARVGLAQGFTAAPVVAPRGDANLPRYPLTAEPANALAAIAAIGSLRPAGKGATTAMAYAAVENSPDPDWLHLVPAVPPLATSPEAREAIAAYRAGDLVKGDQMTAAIGDADLRTTLRWLALRLQPRDAGLERWNAFLTDHSAWPSATWIQRRIEDSLWSDRRDNDLVLATFAARAPLGAPGKLALARARLAKGQTEAAASLVRDVWRNDDLNAVLELAIRKEFPDALTPADHRFRADRLFYKDNAAGAARAAALAGADYQALARARGAVSLDAAKPGLLLAAVPVALRTDPTLVFARVHKLRQAGKFAEAATALEAVPRDPAALLMPDEWWSERRQIARKLLDQGDARTAQKVAAAQVGGTRETRIEAEFLAGWIALRFLNDPARAAGHFDALAEAAQSPVSPARAAFWQARAAEAAGSSEKAQAADRAAAANAATYYGQLARMRAGVGDLPLRAPERIATGRDRDEAVRVVELLLALGQKDSAYFLALDAARSLQDEAQIAALADVAAASHDARITLAVGKIATQRGLGFDNVAWPTFGVPHYAPLGNSAPREIVYAIARQESAFQTDAVSGAGAYGLMQMIVPTARRTAEQRGVPFDSSRLIGDPVFNAQLGAAHLGELLREHQGSLILTFAAYNAGSRRVKEWIAAFGDPRKPEVDPVDWVERIPFTETRNYVQRVMENVAVYRARFAAESRDNASVAAGAAAPTQVAGEP